MLNRLFGLMLSIGATVVGVHSVNPNFPKTNPAIVAPRIAPTQDIDAFNIALPDLKPCPTHYTKKKSISSKKKAHHRKFKMSHARKFHPHQPHHHSHKYHPRHRHHHRIRVHYHHAPHTGPPSGCH